MALKKASAESHISAYAEAEGRLKGSLSGPPTEEQRRIQAGLVEHFIDLYAIVASNIEPGRQRSIALTKLEEAKMFAVAAIFEEN